MKHIYELTIESQNYLDDDELAELRNTIVESLDLDLDVDRVSVDFVDSEG